MPEQNPLNFCRSCGEDFSSVRAFDHHRVGVHAYTYSEGVGLELLREDGRRCLCVGELGDAGFGLNGRGRWELRAEADRARRAFGRIGDEHPGERAA